MTPEESNSLEALVKQLKTIGTSIAETLERREQERIG